MDKLRETQPSPAVIIGLIVAAVVAVLAILFFTVIKPKMEADRAVAEFNSPQAQAKRDPDQRKVDPQLANTIQQLKAKESHMTNANGFGRGAGNR